MGAFSGITKLLNEFTQKTKYASGDFLLVGGSTLNKILVSDLYTGDTYSGNLNTLFLPGYYYVNFANATGGPMTSGNAILEVFKPTATGYIQRVSIYNSDGIVSVRQRIYTGGKWCAWTTIYTNFEIGSKQTFTNNGWSFSYIKIASNQIYFRATKTMTGELGSTEEYTEMTSLPYAIAFEQEYTGTVQVGTNIVGSFRAIFKEGKMFSHNQGYGAGNTRIVSGFMYIK